LVHKFNKATQLKEYLKRRRRSKEREKNTFSQKTKKKSGWIGKVTEVSCSYQNR